MRALLIVLSLGVTGCGLVLELSPKALVGSPDGALGDGGTGRDDGGELDAAREDGSVIDGSSLDATELEDGEIVFPDVSEGCEGVADGVPCGDTAICREGSCQPSECGDGVYDPRFEECDGPITGCVACHLPCTCPAPVDPCVLGVECVAGDCLYSFAPDDMACVPDSGDSGRCVAGTCAPEGCGNSVREGSEQCDDGNDDPTDGCRPNCTYTCESNAHCQDGDRCNGIESCVEGGTGRVCRAGSPPPLSRCQYCDPATGVQDLPDADQDGFPAPHPFNTTCTPFDCDDDNAAVSPAGIEICDGLDNDCDAAIDDGVTVGMLACGVDMDGDRFPGTATMYVGCMCPGGLVPAPRMGGGLVLDCDDENPDVHPGQVRYFVRPRCAIGDPMCAHPYDYNCDGSAQLQFSTRIDCSLLDVTGCSGAGWSDAPPDCGEFGGWLQCEPLIIGPVCTALSDGVQQQGCH